MMVPVFISFADENQFSLSSDPRALIGVHQDKGEQGSKKSMAGWQVRQVVV